MIYLIDSDSLIQSQQVRYPFNNFPGIWDFYYQLHQKEIFYIINKVKEEINKYGPEDLLNKWIKEKNFKVLLFDSDTVGVKDNINLIENKMKLKYEAQGIIKFFEKADSYLVAVAMSNPNYTVVTEEVTSNSTKKIKIPDACKIMGVKCIHLAELIKNEGPRLILANEVSVIQNSNQVINNNPSIKIDG